MIRRKQIASRGPLINSSLNMTTLSARALLKLKSLQSSIVDFLPLPQKEHMNSDEASPTWHSDNVQHI